MEVMNRGHYEIAMRALLFILGVFAVIVSIEKPAEARRGAWCANYNMGGGATNCGFATFQQCMAAVSGVGGTQPVLVAQSAIFAAIRWTSSRVNELN
jgi:Protein of unknown function (DUF3551)